MAIFTTAQKNNMATAYGVAATHAAIFTTPGPPGGASQAATNEVTGGSPAYARKAISWGAAAAGVITGTVTFDVPVCTVTHAGVCSSITANAATVLDAVAVTSQQFNTQGTYVLTLTYTQT